MADAPDGDELALLEAVLAERNGAWNEFFRRYERLMAACIRRVHSRYGVPCASEDLDDLIANVCLQLVRDDYQKLRLYDATRGYRLSSWVGLIATNAAHDALRRRGPPTYSIDEGNLHWTERPAEDPSPSEVLLLREQAETLNRAVAQLSPGEQLFLRYYYQEQRTPEEIAVLLGVSINTVYSRKNKVRASLKRVIDEMGLEGFA